MQNEFGTFSFSAIELQSLVSSGAKASMFLLYKSEIKPSDPDVLWLLSSSIACLTSCSLNSSELKCFFAFPIALLFVLENWWMILLCISTFSSIWACFLYRILYESVNRIIISSISSVTSPLLFRIADIFLLMLKSVKRFLNAFESPQFRSKQKKIME